MLRFVIDEDQPRSLGRLLSEQGHSVKDIRDHGLRGSDDENIYQFAQQNKSVLVTSDFGFSNILHYPPGYHQGIVIVHFPNEMTTDSVNQEVIKQLREFENEKDVRGRLIILEPGKVRIRTA